MQPARSLRIRAPRIPRREEVEAHAEAHRVHVDAGRLAHRRRARARVEALLDVRLLLRVEVDVLREEVVCGWRVQMAERLREGLLDDFRTEVRGRRRRRRRFRRGNELT